MEMITEWFFSRSVCAVYGSGVVMGSHSVVCGRCYIYIVVVET